MPKRAHSPHASNVNIGMVYITMYADSNPPPPTPFYRHRYFWWGVATGFMVCFGITATTSDPALLQWGFDRILTGVGFGN